MIMDQQGITKKTHDAATVGSTVRVDCYGFNAIMIIHKMTGVTTGGFAKVQLKPLADEVGGGIDHPALEGEYAVNPKTAASATDYVSIIRGITRYVDVVLTRTDGSHTVYAIPINV